MSWAALVDTLFKLSPVFLGVIALLYQHRQKRFEILEQSFDVMQRVNELVVSSDENVVAGLPSIQGDEIDKFAARRMYFTYMRINRIFRAYEYRRGFFLSRKERDRIVDSYIGSLAGNPLLNEEFLERGYPPDFRKFLLKRLETAKPFTVLKIDDAKAKLVALPKK